MSKPAITTPRMRTAVLVVLGAAALAGCSGRLDVRGNLPDPEDVLAVHPGESTREQVAQVLGSPSVVGTFDDQTWYYVSKRTETFAFFEPEVIDQEVLVVKFDNTGVVSDMQMYGYEDGRLVDPVERTTPNLGQELTFIQQILGNLGRFNTEDSTSVTGPGGGSNNPGRP
jgi:outer membrane protein assembly factor BamE (lipoprotein component of BamABCDE complex)